MSSVRSAPATEAKNSQPGKTLTPPAAAASMASSSSSVSMRSSAQARIDGGEQVLGDGRFGERQQLRFVEAGLGALGFGVEFADGFNFIAEELDADGTIGFGRVDIENAAAARELAGHFDEVHLRVADAGEVRGEDFDVDFFAALERDGEAGIVIAIEELERGGFDGSDEDVDGAGGELPEGGGALLLHVGVGREILKRKHVVGGKADNACGINRAGKFAAGLEERLEGFGGFVVGDDDDDGLLGGARHEREVESTRRCGECRHTPTTRTQAEVPANAFKARSLLQLRENLADKREDHQSSSLTASDARGINARQRPANDPAGAELVELSVLSQDRGEAASHAGPVDCDEAGILGCCQFGLECFW